MGLFGETANLVAHLGLKDDFSGPLKKADSGLSKFDRHIGTSGSRAFKAGQQIGTGIKRGAVIAAAGMGLLATQVGFGIESLIKLETVTAQTNAVLKSTHGAAGQTTKGILAMANAFENMNATMDDTVIQSGANVLLTFTNIRKKAFEPALKAALNLSTAMGQDLQTSIVQIGKALNDPAKGLTSLTRIGVTFSDQQKNQIKVLMRSGQTLKAQGIILKELNKEFGGSFLAGGNITAGKVAKFKDSIDDLQRALATALLPTIGNVAQALTKLLDDPKTIAGVSSFGKELASLFTSDNIISGIHGVMGALKPLVELVRVAAAPVKLIVDSFLKLPSQLQTVLIGAFAVNKLTGGLVTNVIGGLLETGLKSLRLMNVQAAVVNVNGGIGGGGGLSGVGGAAGGGLASLLGPVMLAAVAAFAAKAVQDQGNAEFNSAGANNANFQVNGVLPFGIDAGIHNLLEGIRLYTDKLNGGTNNNPAAAFGMSGVKDTSNTAAAFGAGHQFADSIANKMKGIYERALAHHKNPTEENVLKTLKRNETKQAIAIALTKAVLAATNQTKAKAQATAAAVKDADSSITARVRGLTDPIHGTTGQVSRSGHEVATALHHLPVPIVNVKVSVTPAKIQRTTTIQYRYGPGNGSSGTPSGGANGGAVPS